VAPPTNFFISRLRSDLSDGLIGTTMFTSVLRREPSTSVGFPAKVSDPSTGDSWKCPNGAPPAIDGRCPHNATTAELDLTYRRPDSSWLAFAAIFGGVISGGPTRTLRDGTSIGSGDTGLGWILRVTKPTGHWLNSLNIHGYSPRLDLNDAGFLPQQNLHTV